MERGMTFDTRLVFWSLAMVDQWDHVNTQFLHIHSWACARARDCTHARTHACTHARTHTHMRVRREREREREREEKGLKKIEGEA